MLIEMHDPKREPSSELLGKGRLACSAGTDNSNAPHPTIMRVGVRQRAGLGPAQNGQPVSAIWTPTGVAVAVGRTVVVVVPG